MTYSALSRFLVTVICTDSIHTYALSRDEPMHQYFISNVIQYAISH